MTIDQRESVLRLLAAHGDAELVLEDGGRLTVHAGHWRVRIEPDGRFEALQPDMPQPVLAAPGRSLALAA